MSHLERKLNQLSSEHKESEARWAKDHPNLPPGNDPKGPTWKSFSRQRKPNEAYREGWDRIFGRG